MRYEHPPATRARTPDYSQWTIEELWRLASQLRVAGARRKNRRELIDFFAVASPKTASWVMPKEPS
jgi:hypothetical protein